MPQQLLISLATEASTWVKLNHPRKTKEGVSLWVDVTKVFEGEGENGQSWEKGWSLVDNLGVKRSLWGSCLYFQGQDMCEGNAASL